MRIQVGVTYRTGHLGDVEMELAARHTVGDVADALARHFGLGGPHGYELRHGSLGPLARSCPVIASGVYTGDTLQLWADPAADRPYGAAVAGLGSVSDRSLACVGAEPASVGSAVTTRPPTIDSRVPAAASRLPVIRRAVAQSVVVDSAAPESAVVRTAVAEPGPVRSAINTAVGPQLVVTAGPDAGRSVALRHGSVMVGRDGDCELVLTDPQVSRHHLRLTTDDDGRAIVESLASAGNGSRLDGAPLTGRSPVAPGQVLRLGTTSLVIRRRLPVAASPLDGCGTIAFHRSPYFPSPVPQTVIPGIDDVPAEPDRPRFAYLSALIPLLLGVGFALLFGPRYLLFALLSPVMLVGSHVERRRRAGRSHAEAVRRFEQQLQARTEQVEEALTVERRQRFAAAPDIADLVDRAAARSPELWVRDRSAGDFLRLRVGLGEVVPELRIDPSRGGDDHHQKRIAELLGSVEVIGDVPVSIDFTKQGTTALVGRPDDVDPVASSLLIQACCLHSPEDLVVVAALSPARRMEQWMKWLPHCRSEASLLAGHHLVDTGPDGDELLSRLLAEADSRRERAVDRPWLLLVLDQTLPLNSAAVDQLLDRCPHVGMSVLWLTDSPRRVPRQTAAVVHCRAPGSGQTSQISFTDPDRAAIEVDTDRLSSTATQSAARSLSPLRDGSSPGAASAIPAVVTLFDAFGVQSVDRDWIADRWREDRGYSLSTPIGLDKDGRLFLDVVKDGPHGLIGGTSGAGKSELVMSLVAGLMAHNSPKAVNFLFVDYKGGASSEVFRAAPHTVGHVTNLDGALAKRALTSLRAELDRRMGLLQGQAKDLGELRERAPDQAPPSLVIVVDEFATLIKEIPDFVAGMVDIAQRGRSLGIHLLLATQRPSGAVNDNIKANTNLRISLRMLDGAESSSVIGVSDAANIPAPLKGRGYLRSGAGRPGSFQSAWATAPLLAATGTPPVAIRPFGMTGPSTAVSGPAAGLATAAGLRVAEEPGADRDRSRSESAGSDRTQVQAVVAAASAVADRLGHRRGPAPWLDPLPTHISLCSVRPDAAESSDGQTVSPTTIGFGAIDDPAAQAQYPAVVDLAETGGVLITGGAGSGKTTALRTMAMAAAVADSEGGGGNLTIIALDFASRELSDLRSLPQCAAVATGDDLEAVTRVISLLHQEFERRRADLAHVADDATGPGVDIAADVDSGGGRAGTSPPVLLLIDGMDALTQTMEQTAGIGGLSQYYNRLVTVIADGHQVGMHPLVSAARVGGVRSTVTAALTNRLMLRQTDMAGYADSGIGSAELRELELRPGLGLFNGPTLVQVAGLVDHGQGPDQAIGNSSDFRDGERRAVKVMAGSIEGSVDPLLTTAPLPTTVPLLPSPDPQRPIVGLTDLNANPFALDLTHDDVSVVGDPRSGRSTALAAIGAQVAGAGAEVWVLGEARSPLRQLRWSTMACFEQGEERCCFVEELLELTAEQPAVARLLLVDDVDLLPEHDRTLTAALEQLLGRVRFVAASGRSRGFNANPVLQRVRASRSMILLRPHDAREAQETIGGPVPWHPGLPMPEGRGFVLVDRIPTMVQLSDGLAQDPQD